MFFENCLHLRDWLLSSSRNFGKRWFVFFIEELKSRNIVQWGITDHPTCIASPNLNAYAERFVRSVRRECLDHFIVLGRRHLKNLLQEYITYYNHRRPHHGLGNQIPSGRPPNPLGPIRSGPVLFGLFRDFYRSA